VNCARMFCLLVLLVAPASFAVESVPATPHVLPPSAQGVDAKNLIREAMNLWRGSSSISELQMTIKRVGWQRTMSMKAWTKGEGQSLVRVTGPKKDVGNGTLLIDDALWSYSPKINRVIKIPSSMMGQSWMGSDFTNKDISKSTDVLDQYDHRLLDVRREGERTLYLVEAIPHEDAAVVWGRELYWVRDDFIVMEQQFWDQDNRLVKTLSTLEVVEMGGRPVAKRMRMADTESDNEWTEMNTLSIQFDTELAESLFTLSNLRNPR